MRRPEELSAHQSDLQAADVLLFYSAGDGGGDLMTNVNHIDGLGKDVIFFVRHKSGPLYYWYEGAMARLLHQHTDTLASKTIKYEDVVVDSLDEVRWRLQSLCGLYNTRGSRIVAIGGPSGWAQPAGVVPDLARQHFQLDIQTVSYEELGKLIQAARDDKAAVDQARERADAYLKLPGTTLETQRPFIDNAFLLEQVFRQLMAQANCRALTINECMGTIMPLAQTTACLTLSLLNDAGYLAFCESDFVVIPAGILLANISGPAGVLERSDLPARRDDHVGPLHRATGNGRRPAGRGTDHDPFRIGLRGGSQGRNADGSIGHQPGAGFQGPALDRTARPDRSVSLPAHLPLADRHSHRVSRPGAGGTHARVPLDHRLRRPPARGRLCRAQSRYCLGEHLARHRLNDTARSRAVTRRALARSSVTTRPGTFSGRTSKVPTWT